MWSHTFEPFVVFLSPSQSHYYKPLTMSLYPAPASSPYSQQVTLPTPLQRTWRSSDRNSLNILADHLLLSHVPWLWDTWPCLLKKKCFLISRTTHSPGSLPPPERFILTRTLHWLSPSICSPGSILTLIFFSLCTSSSDVQALPGPLMRPSFQWQR